MASNEDFGKVLHGSLSLALADGFLKTQHDSWRLVESQLEDTTPSDGRDLDVEVAQQFGRKAYLLLVVAELESVVIDTCQDLSTYLATTLRPDDLYGPTEFQRARTYLRKVFQSRFPKEHVWARFETYRRARHAVAHTGNLSFPSGEEKRRDEVATLPGLEVDSPQVFTMTPEFCERLFEFSLHFVRDVQSLATHLYDMAAKGDA